MDGQRARIDPAGLRKMMQRPLITDEERRVYGDEALSVMERKAREVVQPVVTQAWTVSPVLGSGRRTAA